MDSEVKRRSRVREKFNGFKPSGCKLANCLGCNLEPPTLSLDTLQNIGTKICQLSTEEVEEAALNSKKKPKPIAKKKGKNNGNKDEAEDGMGPSMEKKAD